MLDIWPTLLHYGLNSFMIKGCKRTFGATHIPQSESSHILDIIMLEVRVLIIPTHDAVFSDP
jgi:hypothetical protein